MIQIPEFTKFDSVITSAMEEFQKRYYQLMEEHLTKAVIAIEGFMPSNEEISRHARKMVFPNGRVEWVWKNNVILVQPEPTEENLSSPTFSKTILVRK